MPASSALCKSVWRLPGCEDTPTKSQRSSSLTENLSLETGSEGASYHLMRYILCLC